MTRLLLWVLMFSVSIGCNSETIARTAKGKYDVVLPVEPCLCRGLLNEQGTLAVLRALAGHGP